MASKGKRVSADCRKFPSKKKCTLMISGSMNEVFPMAMSHAIKSHGHKNTPSFRKSLRSTIK